MKRWKAYFFNILVSKESKNKKPFKYLTTKSDYLKGLRGVLKKVLSFIIPQERKFLKWIIKNYTSIHYVLRWYLYHL